MQNKKLREIILIILTTAVVILTALNSVIYFTRADLTENKSFTISDTTKKIIRAIPEKIHITYYISDKIKNITPVATEIEDLLFEYSARSRGRIDVVSVDPARLNLTNKAQSLGINPQQIEVYEKNEQSFAMVYSGITIQYLDKYETIPFILNLETLEYDLTHRIRKLVENIDVKVGIIIGDSRKSMENHYTYVGEKLQQSYGVELIETGKEIPPGISMLAVIGNKDISEGDMLYIDEYIMTGGKVIFCVDGVDVDMSRNLTAVKLENSPVIETLKKYGLRVNNDLVLDKYAKRIPLRGSFPMLYPQWIGIAGQNVSKTNPVTSRFAGLDLLWASSVEEADTVDGIVYERLVSTSDQAWVMDKNITTSPYEVSAEAGYKGDDQRQIGLAYLASGKFKSAFTEKTGNDSKIIVIGDSDFVSDIIQFSDSPYNIMFFENAVEWLSNDESLLQIKTRNKRDLRLNKIESQEGRVKAILFVYLINIVIVPAAVIAFAVIRYLQRKRREA